MHDIHTEVDPEVLSADSLAEVELAEQQEANYLRDLGLVNRMKKRDEVALAEVLKIHTPLIRTIIGRIVNNETDVDDLLSEVGLELWKSIDGYDESKGKFLGWFVTLARRRSIDRVRRRQAYNRAIDRVQLERHQTEAIVERDDSVESGFNKDQHRRLNELLHSVHIPDFQRECLILHYFQTMSQREIAKFLKRPLGTVKTQLELGIRKIGSLVYHDKVFAKEREQE